MGASVTKIVFLTRRQNSENSGNTFHTIIIIFEIMNVNSHDMNLEILKNKFTAIYGDNGQGIKIYFAPGRVNLIGEHTDYNGGYVFPCALHFGTYLLLRSSRKDEIRLSSTLSGETVTIPVAGFTRNEVKWVNYPVGVMDQFRERGFGFSGLDLLFAGDVPHAAGLSSSASIEMVTAVAFNDHLNFRLDMIDLIKLSQKAENVFVGVNCGIMDQFASGMGKKDHAVFLDCATLRHETVPLLLGKYQLIISNTNKKRGLADSKYNERRSECDKSVIFLSTEKPVKYLGELDYAQFTGMQHLIPDETIRRRAHHVVSENQRVLDAVGALKNSDLRKFGQLMNASHDSLRYDYEVTGNELDTLVEEARKINGVIGSRMTGAGFGGCTVSLVEKSVTNNFITSVGASYRGKTGLTADFYIAEIGNGAGRIG
jgi:galactokinase